MKKIAVLLALVGIFLLIGCRTHQPSGPVILDPAVVDHNPFGSAEIKQCAKEIAPSLLGAPEFNQGHIARVIVRPLQNRSSLRLDMAMITDSIENELAIMSEQSGHTTVRFITENQSMSEATSKVMKEKLEVKRERMLDEVAEAILALPLVVDAEKPPVIAVTPVVNSNLINMNANSFMGLLRAKIAKMAKGKIMFTAPGSMQGADYYLTGEFIAESMQNEGKVNLVDYITLMEDRLKAGKPMEFFSDIPNMKKVKESEYAGKVETTLTFDGYQNLLGELSRQQDLRVEPDVSKYLNVMLIRPADKIAVYENVFMLDKKTESHLANVDYILSGNVSSVSRRAEGHEETYVVVTLFLLDPESAEELWTGRYETKKGIIPSVVY